MLTRLTHAAMAFAVTAVLYQAYVLAVVPFIEPPWSSEHFSSAAGEPFETSADALHKYRELLAQYFPRDHWCLARPPKTLENGQALIVFDEYSQSPSGELRAPHCAVVIFPRPRDPGGPAPSDAIILEPSQGAVLQMEQTLGKGLNGFGKLQFGQLQGEITIRSQMRDPGPEDDLLITTRDLYMNEDLIRTDQPVNMRLGDHHGYGRELEMRFIKTEGAAGGADGLFGRIEDLEDLTIKHDVSMTVMPGKLRLSGEGNERAKPQAEEAMAAAGDEPAAPPIRIKSAGPFRIDLGAYKASFSDRVQAWQVHPDGKMDELRAHELTLFFTKTTQWNSGAGGVTPASEEAAAASPLAFEPASIEARGTPEAPVVLKAPSQETTAAGQRLWIELAGRSIHSITLEEGEEVVLTHRGAEIHARTLRYQLPPKGSGQRLGAMAARGGGGWLRAVVDPARPDQILEVSWKDAMQLLRRPDGQPVLVLDGRPKVELAGMGTLWADRLQIFLREQPLDAANPPGKMLAGSLPSSVLPEKITAMGRVAIESTQLTGKVNELHIKIEHPSLADAASGVAPLPLGAKTQAGGQRSPLFDPNGQSDRSYDISGVTLRLDAVMRNRRPEVRAINVDGGVVFQESAPGGGAEPPLRIVAEHLLITGADTPNAQIEIRGAGGQNGLPVQLAEITARGAKLLAPALVLNRGASTAAINSPGELHLMVDRDMTGNPLPRPEPLAIVWQDSMKLEGRRITFLGDVRVEHASGWLHTRRLVAQTTADVRFDSGGPRQPELEQLECWEGAVAEFTQQDLSGVTSRQHIELKSLTVNQTNGNIGGEGPGSIDSVHLAKSPGNWLALPEKGAVPPPQLVQTEPELRHLHIDFIRGVGGNLHTRTVNVEGNVEAVYGPVASWDDRLSMSPGGSPRPDEVWITSHQLGVTESPMARIANPRLRQVELMAQGDVVIEGQDAKQGAFTAYGHRAKFDQSKGQFILEGDGQRPATIEQQQFPGGPRSPQSAQRMTFNQKTGAIKIDGLQKGQFNQFDLGRQPQAPAPR